MNNDDDKAFRVKETIMGFENQGILMLGLKSVNNEGDKIGPRRQLWGLNMSGY